jgi:hypothetical protein
MLPGCRGGGGEEIFVFEFTSTSRLVVTKLKSDAQYQKLSDSALKKILTQKNKISINVTVKHKIHTLVYLTKTRIDCHIYSFLHINTTK